MRHPFADACAQTCARTCRLPLPLPWGVWMWVTEHLHTPWKCLDSNPHHTPPTCPAPWRSTVFHSPEDKLSEITFLVPFSKIQQLNKVQSFFTGHSADVTRRMFVFQLQFCRCFKTVEHEVEKKAGKQLKIMIRCLYSSDDVYLDITWAAFGCFSTALTQQRPRLLVVASAQPTGPLTALQRSQLSRSDVTVFSSWRNPH